MKKLIPNNFKGTQGVRKVSSLLKSNIRKILNFVAINCSPCKLIDKNGYEGVYL